MHAKEIGPILLSLRECVWILYKYFQVLKRTHLIMFIRKNIVSYKDLITKYGFIRQLSGYNYMVRIAAVSALWAHSVPFPNREPTTGGVQKGVQSRVARGIQFLFPSHSNGNPSPTATLYKSNTIQLRVNRRPVKHAAKKRFLKCLHLIIMVLIRSQ